MYKKNIPCYLKLIIKEMIININILWHLSESLKNDVNFICSLVKFNHKALVYAGKAILNDK